MMAASVIHSVEDRSNIAHNEVWCEIDADPFCEMPNRNNMFTTRCACTNVVNVMVYYTNKSYLHVP